jgi:hypothetical protein
MIGIMVFMHNTYNSYSKQCFGSGSTSDWLLDPIRIVNADSKPDGGYQNEAKNVEQHAKI